MLGMLTLEQLKELVKNEEIETVIVGFTDHIGRIMGKRFDADFFVDDAIKNGTHACNYLLTVDMEMTPIPGFTYANWELGYGDFHLLPDFSTLRRASWLDKTALILCDLKEDKTNSYTAVAPRSILRKQIKKLNESNYTAMAASELEYYLYNKSYKKLAKNNFNKMEAAGWYIEDYNILQSSREEKFTAQARKHLKNSGIPVETSKGEWGLGQHELNIRYSEALEMADRHTIFKQICKELADATNMSLTFMAKPFSGQAGSSCHIHFSLWSTEENAFKGNKELSGIQCSDEFRWFLGGWIKYASEMMVFYAPTINSYKRYEDASWAPTRLAWSYDNRTAGFRVVGKGQSLRIENRIPGADCNPYLAYAASLASGLKGIQDKIEPPEIFEGDIYAAKDLPRVPYTLKEAIVLFEKSEFAKEVFGAEVVEHYCHYFKKEQESFDNYVTDWERKRYFERI